MDIKINLAKLKSAVITTQKGNRAIIIVLDDNNLVEHKSGVYLELQAVKIREPKTNNHGFMDTHFVKQKLSKDAYGKLTEEQKKAIPILGNITEYTGVKTEDEGFIPPSKPQPEVTLNNDDLPF